MTLLRHGLLCAAFAVCLGGAEAAAECVSAPDLAPGLTAPVPVAPTGTRLAPPTPVAEGAIGATGDSHGRVVVPMSVNGQGPYRFIVDTGANRSVLSDALTQALGLTPNGQGVVHSIEGVQSAPMVDVRALNFGAVALNNSSLPVLRSLMMGGEQGLLGVDGMRGKRLTLDFDRRCIEIIASRAAPRLRGWTEVTGQLRFGDLVIVHGLVHNVRVNVLIDTGSDISLANVAFRDAVDRLRAHYTEFAVDLAFTASRPIILANSVVLPELRMSSMSITDMVLYIGNYHVFDLWGFRDEPTILLGMDVLSHIHAIAIDYQRGTVSFRLPARS